MGHVSGAERQRNMQPPKTRREAGGDKRVAAPVFGGKGWSKHDPNPAAYPMHTRTPAIPDVSVGGSMRGSGGAVVEKDEGRNTGGNTEVRGVRETCTDARDNSTCNAGLSLFAMIHAACSSVV